jgi:hypothetical protein
MLQTCKVICIAFEPDGSRVAGAVFSAKLNRSVVYQGLVLADEIAATANEEGVATLNLWPNALSKENTFYEVRIDVAGRAPTFGRVYVPNVDTVELHTIAEITGATGATGIQGFRGAIGPAGPIGPIGPQGSRGELGAVGKSGRDGINGTDGIDGQQGIEGPMGPPGPLGATGPRGEVTTLDGVTLTGPIGPRGPMGPRGYSGDRGLMGATGPQGESGHDTQLALQAMYTDQGHLMTTVTAALREILK